MLLRLMVTGVGELEWRSWYRECHFGSRGDWLLLILIFPLEPNVSMVMACRALSWRCSVAVAMSIDEPRREADESEPSREELPESRSSRDHQRVSCV